MNLRKLARDKPCMVRIPGVCDGGGETTILAHYRLSGTCGGALKPPDLLGAWCCGPCHAHVGDRGPDLAEGVMRTQYELVKLGILSPTTGEISERALAELTEQAQELDMGY